MLKKVRLKVFIVEHSDLDKFVEIMSVLFPTALCHGWPDTGLMS